MAKTKQTITTIWVYLSAGYPTEKAYTLIRRHFRRKYPNDKALATAAAYFPLALICAVRQRPGFDIGPVEIDFEGLAEYHFDTPNALDLAVEAMAAWKGEGLSGDDGFSLTVRPDGTASINWPALAIRHKEATAHFFSEIQKDRAAQRWNKDADDMPVSMPVQCRDNAGIMPASMPSNHTSKSNIQTNKQEESDARAREEPPSVKAEGYKPKGEDFKTPQPGGSNATANHAAALITGIMRIPKYFGPPPDVFVAKEADALLSELLSNGVKQDKIEALIRNWPYPYKTWKFFNAHIVEALQRDAGVLPQPQAFGANVTPPTPQESSAVYDEIKREAQRAKDNPITDTDREAMFNALRGVSEALRMPTTTKGPDDAAN